MPFDGFLLNRVIEEISTIKTPLRQIYQTGKSTFYFHFQSKTIRICLNPAAAHMCLAKREEFSDITPSSFLMLLRSRLKNSRFKSAEQVGLDRVARLTFLRLDEIGRQHTYEVYVEFLGRHCNLVLVENGIIIDAHKKHSVGNRNILRNQTYPIPKQSKINPLLASFDSLTTECSNKSVSKTIISNIAGFSNITANEVLTRANLQDKPYTEVSAHEKLKLLESLKSVVNDFRKGKTYVYHIDGEIEISTFPLHIFENSEVKIFESASQAIQYFYNLTSSRDKLKQTKLSLCKIVNSHKEKLAALAGKLYQELRECDSAEKMRYFGELLKSCSKKAEGKDFVIATDWETQEKFVIPIDPSLGISGTREHYFKQYKKMKNKIRINSKRIKDIERRLEYYEQLLHTIESADDLQGLSEIREEMFKQGLIKAKKERADKLRKTKPFRRFKYKEFTVLVGRNNTENDRIVREADQNELWFHAHGMPGAHVVVKGAKKKVPQDVIEFASSLAAFYSKGRNSDKVPVDHTLIKHVRKAKGLPPGMVIYNNYKTILSKPLKEKEIKYHMIEQITVQKSSH